MADNRQVTTESCSGQDLDVWGGEVTTPIVIPRPGGSEDCKRKDNGICPPGCRLCLEFAEEMKINHGEHGGHGE